MRKTTEELANAAVSELKDSQFDFNDLDAVDKQMLFQWFETFRRLVIENERECAEAVGVTASLPGTNNGYTFVAFNGSDVPVGTKLFTFPPASIDRNAVIEEMAKEFDSCSDGVQMRPAYVAIVLRALKSQPAAPDQRDEVIRLLKEKFEHIREYWNGDTNHAAMVDALNHIDDVAFEAIAAIDSLPKKGVER